MRARAKAMMMTMMMKRLRRLSQRALRDHTIREMALFKRAHDLADARLAVRAKRERRTASAAPGPVRLGPMGCEERVERDEVAQHEWLDQSRAHLPKHEEEQRRLSAMTIKAERSDAAFCSEEKRLGREEE